MRTTFDSICWFQVWSMVYIFPHRQNEMYGTQIQNELGFKVRENLQLNNTDKTQLPACYHWKHDNNHSYWPKAK